MNRKLDEILMADHDEIDGYFSELAEGGCCMMCSDPKDKIAALERVTERLLKHIRFEEEELFPRFEEKAGMSAGQGPTEVMRTDHAYFKMMLGEAKDLLSMREADEFRERISKLMDALSEHNMKEERILYPACMDLFDGETKDRLARIAADILR